MAYYFRVNIFVTMIILFTSALGSSAPHVVQDVLADSKIKKTSFKKVLGGIKKSLPKQLKKCSIVVAEVKLLRADDELNIAEEWTIDACDEKKVYFVSTSTWPKGYWINNVMPREEKIAKEKEILKSTIEWLDDERYTKDFYYLEEIFNDDEFKKWSEEHRK